MRALLIPETMEAQMSQIDLLMAMYPSPGDLIIDQSTHQVLSELRQYCNQDQDQDQANSLPDSVTLSLNLTIDNETSGDLPICLIITVPLNSDKVDLTEAPPPKIRIRQPEWMSKADVVEVTTTMPTSDIFTAIDHIHEQASKRITSIPQPQPSLLTTTTPITRVWFYFPSLSTREKRNDLVHHAPTYNLTGFVLAGKPGLLCLEGPSTKIDAYMKFIKTESWGDIPPHQKKVSERYREEGADVKRVFTDMQEITDKLGEKRGERANRGDMKALEIWLNERDLGRAFGKVLM